MEDVTPLLAKRYLAMHPLFLPPPSHPASTPAVCSLGPSASCLLRLRTVINRQSKLRPFSLLPPWFHINISLLCRRLAFLKCQKNCPKAFRPVKLSQTCKTEPLMKYINLEHSVPPFTVLCCLLTNHHGVWSGGEKRGCAVGWRYTWQACYWGKRVCSDLVAGKHWCITVSSSRIEQMKRFVQHHWYDWQRRGRSRKKINKTELSQDHICLADTADVPTDCWVKMSYCVSGFLERL